MAPLCLAVALAAGALFYWRSSGDHTQTQNTSSLRSAPDFELADALGAKHKLSEFRGNVVIIHFWAAWCPPCLGEIPNWVELANEFKGKKLKLIAISADPKWENALKILPTEKAQGITSLLDSSTEVPELFGTYQYPETYVLNSDLKVVMKWVGSQDWKNPAILTFLTKLIPS